MQPLSPEPPAPTSAYVHVPFCAHRCGYCNFTVVADRADLVEAYLEAIERELAGLVRPREVKTLYLGGGTPSFLDPEPLRRLLSIVTTWHPLSGTYEFSVEANPDDVVEEKMQLFAEFGVNRISLGGQSFNEIKLNLLERNHRAPQIHRAYQLAEKYFPTVSLDLIFATPGETLSEWSTDLQSALALAPGHLSTYSLTFEKGTLFWNRRHKGQLTQVAEELERSMFALAIDALGQRGYEHYEVSSFAQPGQRCRHNEVYWTGRSYFAVGPGAARYVDGRREVNHRSTATYLKRVLSGNSPIAESERLEPEDVARETLVFGLRRLEGVGRRQFADQTGFDLDLLVANELRRLVQLGLLVDEGWRIRLSQNGLFVSDSIWPHLLIKTED